MYEPDPAGVYCEQSRALEVPEVLEGVEGLRGAGRGGAASVTMLIASSAGM